MPRNVIGHTLSFAIPQMTSPNPTPNPMSTPGSPTPPAKLDVFPLITLIDSQFAPCPVQINVPAYDLAAYNSLQKVFAIIAPANAVLPTDADTWLNSGFPMASIMLPPNSPVTVVAAPAPVVAAPIVAPVVAAPIAVPVPVAVPVAVPIPVAVPTSSTPTPVFLPGPTGGNAVIDVDMGAVFGLSIVQLINQFDV